MTRSDKVKRIAIDLDGTITENYDFKGIWDLTPNQLSNIYRKLKPNNKIIKIVNKLFNKGYTVFIFTSRSNMYQSITKSWLNKYKVKYHYLVVDKPYYEWIIDDKSITPEELIRSEKWKEL